MSLRSEALSQGLSSEEYDRIISWLGREPNRVELGIFAVMWSEHCCYKSSKIHLKQLPTRGAHVLLGPGENAGIIDLGDDYILSFKVESHNHPSYIEPVQGAATGVGGILRDIFTMGTRPVAVLDSLHFGKPDHPKTAFLVHGVVSGIGGYGNCMGIPNVGGEVAFDASYNGNILVNAMAVGVGRKGDLQKGIAKGIGNRVIYLGSKTGRDGIHGATMASQEFGGGNEERRPTVQVGDPFTEKLLMEATLEMIQKKLLVGVQDMGAAGLACSTFEMSGRARTGMNVNLDRVPLREAEMHPYEMFLSESQERMLMVAEPENVSAIMDVARKWEVDCVEIGEVTDTGRVVASYKGEVCVDLPVAPITDDAPLYDRPSVKVKERTKTIAEESILKIKISEVANKFLQHANLSDKAYIYQQYDSTVGSDTVYGPGGDSAVLRIKGTNKAFAATLDSNSYYCEADPYIGTMHVVAEAVRNLSCVGAKAVATTNCLNFGNPEDPAIMFQLKESIRGMGDACRFFQTPITGGNVSLYNQTNDQNILPTPTIGMIGLLPVPQNRISSRFVHANEIVYLVGNHEDRNVYESLFARDVLGEKELACPPLDLNLELTLQRTLLQLISEEVISSARDCSEGGLFQTLVEMTSYNQKAEQIGFVASSQEQFLRPSFVFGEYGGRVVISVPIQNQQKLELVLRNQAVSFLELGKTGGSKLNLGESFKLSLKDIFEMRNRLWSAL